MVVKLFNYFQVFSIDLSCLYCVFFDKCEFTHMIALRIKESCVKLGIRNYFGCFNDLTFQKQINYHGKKIIHIYFGDRNRLEKIVLLSFI